MGIREDLQSIPSGRSDLRKFGLTVGTVLLGLALFSLWRDNRLEFWFLVPAAAILAGAGLMPLQLKPLQRVWMTLALLMGWMMTRVVLTLLFYGVVTPLGCLARLLGQDVLQRRIDPDVRSYWIPRTNHGEQKKDYERQF